MTVLGLNQIFLLQSMKLTDAQSKIATYTFGRQLEFLLKFRNSHESLSRHRRLSGSKWLGTISLSFPSLHRVHSRSLYRYLKK